MLLPLPEGPGRGARVRLTGTSDPPRPAGAQAGRLRDRDPLGAQALGAYPDPLLAASLWEWVGLSAHGAVGGPGARRPDTEPKPVLGLVCRGHRLAQLCRPGLMVGPPQAVGARPPIQHGLVSEQLSKPLPVSRLQFPVCKMRVQHHLTTDAPVADCITSPAACGLCEG